MKKNDDTAYHQLFLMNPMPMMILDTETLGFLAANNAALNHYGYTREEFLSMSALDIRPIEDANAAVKRMRDAQPGLDQVGIWRHKKKDGSVILVQIISHEILYEGKPARIVMCNDVTEQHRAQEVIQESEEKYQKLFNMEMDAICIFDVQSKRLLDVNDAYVQLYGYSKEETLELTTDDISAEPEVTTQAIQQSDEKGNVFIPFRRHRKKDGSEMIVEITAGPFEWKGRRVMYAVIREISERIKAEQSIKDALKHKEVLLKEVHHRVKNNLQAVAGMLNLQAGLMKDKETLKVFQENEARILSMALIHEKLYQVEDPSKINLGDYVKSLVGRLVKFYSISPDKIKTSVKAAKISLNLDTIVPVGLIINELVSNSLKYAFPDGREGEIKVSLSRRKDGTLNLKVSDNGIGLPEEVDIGRSKSLGMMLVKSFVDGLSGTVKVSRKTGTEITITFREYLEHGIEYTS